MRHSCHVSLNLMVAASHLTGWGSVCSYRPMPNESHTPWTGASDERLDIIESNECSYHPAELSTKRFRRVFNEYHAMATRVRELEARCSITTI